MLDTRWLCVPLKAKTPFAGATIHGRTQHTLTCADKVCTEGRSSFSTDAHASGRQAPIRLQRAPWRPPDQGQRAGGEPASLDVRLLDARQLAADPDAGLLVGSRDALDRQAVDVKMFEARAQEQRIVQNSSHPSLCNDLMRQPRAMDTIA